MNNSVKFILTKEYKKFEEFCNSCKDYQYIGLCYGIPGIGKTLSAVKYSNWNEIDNFYDTNFEKFFKDQKSLPKLPEVQQCDTILITASPTNTPSRIDKIISSEAHKLKFIKHFSATNTVLAYTLNYVQEDFSELKLLIIDEADHLKYTSLEQLRSLYDKYQFGMVLIGMPGIERRISRYPQLYSRVGFLHEFKTLSKDEMIFIIENHLTHLGTEIKLANFSDYETLNTIVRITKGNLRVLTRLFQQLERLIKINNVTSINADLVNTAREVLVTGS
jgi:DNA transposition AAA+ family ATPase